MLTDDKLPPLPKCDIYDPNRFGVGWREASMRAYGQACQAAATAEARALVSDLLEALETGREATYELAQAFHTAYKGHRAEQHAAADDDVQRLDIALAAARAWLGEAKGDGHHGM